MIAATDEVITRRLMSGLFISLPADPTIRHNPLVLLDAVQNPRGPMRSRSNQFLRVLDTRHIERTRSVRHGIYALHGLIECAVMHDVLDNDVVEFVRLEEIRKVLALGF